MEPIEPPWQAIKEWIPGAEPDPDWFDQTPAWKAPKIQLNDGRILVLEYT